MRGGRVRTGLEVAVDDVVGVEVVEGQCHLREVHLRVGPRTQGAIVQSLRVSSSNAENIKNPTLDVRQKRGGAMYAL